MLRDIQAAAQGALFQHVVTMLVPGAVALGPFVIWVFWRFPEVRTIAAQSLVASGLIITLTLLVVGLLLFEIGSFIEVKWMDQRLDCRTGNKHSENWYRYLALELPEDHNGRRYVGRMVVFLKFELATMVGFPLCALSFLILFRGAAIPPGIWWLIVFVSLVSTILQTWAAHQTHEALSAIRGKIVGCVKGYTRSTEFLD